MVSLSEKVNLSTIFAPTTIAAVCVSLSLFNIHTTLTNISCFFWFCLKIIALVIGLINPVRELIIGNVAPLGVLQDSVTLVG